MPHEQISLTKEFKTFFSPLKRRAILIFIVLAIVVFSNGLFNEFVGDDHEQILYSETTQSITNIGFFFTNSLKNFDYYRPLFTAVLSAIFSVWGPSPFAYHAVQLFLHILSTILLFLVMRKLLKEQIAFAISLVFLIHPINSEAVFYISDLQDVLFLFFGIFGFWRFINAKSNRHIIFAAILFLLSILAKEPGIIFLPTAIVYSWFYRREMFYKILGCSFLVSLTYLFLRLNAAESPEGIPWYSPISVLDFWDRILNIPAVLFYYIKTFFYPLDLSVSYQWVHKSVNFTNFYGPLFADLLFFGAIIYFFVQLFKRHRDYIGLYIMFAVWFLLGLGLHSQIIPLASATVADRWFYSPIIGLLGIIGVLLQAYNINLRNKYVISMFFILVSLFSVRSFVRSFDWRDNFTLTLHDAKVSDSHILENAVSGGYLEKGKIEEAKIHAEKSIQLFPYYTNYLALGNVYFAKKDYEKAKSAYLKGLEYGDPPQLYNNLALIYSQDEDLDTAQSFIKKALERYPKEGKLWFAKGIVEYKLGHLEVAKSDLLLAYKLDKTIDASSLYNTILEEQKSR